jgi:hypothetical protein
MYTFGIYDLSYHWQFWGLCHQGYDNVIFWLVAYRGPKAVADLTVQLIGRKYSNEKFDVCQNKFYIPAKLNLQYLPAPHVTTGSSACIMSIIQKISERQIDLQFSIVTAVL